MMRARGRTHAVPRVAARAFAQQIALQLTALFFLALAIRVGYRLWWPPVPDPDQKHHADLAHNIAKGRGYEAFGNTKLEI